MCPICSHRWKLESSQPQFFDVKVLAAHWAARSTHLVVQSTGVHTICLGIFVVTATDNPYNVRPPRYKLV